MKSPALKFLADHLKLTPEQVEALDQPKFDAAVLGLAIVPKADYDTLTREHTEQATSIQTLTKEKNDAVAAKDTATKEIETLTSEKTANAAFVESGKTHLAQLRAAAKDAYTKFAKGAPDATILAELETGDVAALEAKAKMWGAAVAVGFEAHCTKCGTSDSISMRSSVAPPNPTNEPGADEAEETRMRDRFRH